MVTITQKSLLNIINTCDVTFLLGAGCSISSGCMNAKTLIYEFKKRIYCNDLKEDINKFSNLSDELKKVIDDHFIGNKISNEYSYYFEKCFPLKQARMEFIKSQFGNKNPSIGYLCFAKILESKKVRFVYTTNFDNLIAKAITKLNPNYDIGKVNDTYLPLTKNDITIDELHGDYNYDLPKNTINELDSLGENTKLSLLSCPSRIIIIMGYSGADKSIMNALKEFVRQNKSKYIVWCAFDGYVSSEVEQLIDYAYQYNEDSCICNFEGFDELCISYYKQYLPKDNKIDEDIKLDVKLEYSSCYNLNKRESLSSNLFKCISFPQTYVFDNIDSTKELFEKINEKYIGRFYKNKLYFIGDVEWLTKQFEIKEYKLFYFTSSFIKENISLSIKLLKDFITKSIIKSNANIKKYKDLYYFTDKKDEYNIFNGFSIDFEFINEELYLAFKQEFVCLDEKTEYIKNQIRQLYSKLYNANSFNWIQSISRKFNYNFKLFETNLTYLKNPLTLSDLQYTLLDEPLVTTNEQNKNISALSCISLNGIFKPPYIKNDIKICILCPVEYKRELSIYFSNLEQVQNSKDKIYPNYLGFKKMFGIKINYVTELFSISECSSFGFEEYTSFIINKLEKIKQSRNPDLVVVYTPHEFSRFEFDINKNKNLHDYIKLHAASNYLTQFISYKSINSTDSLCKKMWNLAIAIYTKIVNLPWKPVCNSLSTAFIGIGYGISNDGITVGCSQMFDSQGRGLQLLLKPVSAKKTNPYMTETEAYEVGKSLYNMFYKTYPTKELRNVVIHKKTQFKSEEIAGLNKAFSHIDNLELIQLIEKPDIKAIKFSGKFPDNYPLSRGTLIKISDTEALLWTHGNIKRNDFNNNINYVKGGKGYPSPILIKVFEGNTPLETIASDILMLTKMDYNSADILYSNLPVTIKYTNKVVDIIKQDSNTLTEVDFRYII